ncbi:unnamed protein product [Lampetra fluviatilis]
MAMLLLLLPLLLQNARQIGDACAIRPSGLCLTGEASKTRGLHGGAVVSDAHASVTWRRPAQAVCGRFDPGITTLFSVPVETLSTLHWARLGARRGLHSQGSADDEAGALLRPSLPRGPRIHPGLFPLGPDAASASHEPRACTHGPKADVGERDEVHRTPGLGLDMESASAFSCAGIDLCRDVALC